VTSYLDEYIPNTKQVSRQVQTDTRKLKFNNIQSCLALMLLPAGGQQMVGVHLSIATTNKPDEIKQVVGELRAAVGNTTCDAYIVANYTEFHARTGLGKALKKLARKVYVCDLPAASDKDKSADADVKIELSNGVIAAYVRRHAIGLKDPANPHAFLRKPNAKIGAGAVPGKPTYLTDRDQKPWMPVPFQPLL
jgi:hypothetical protein